jgi:DNA-binding GntR family transcriptional regulator
LFSVRAVLENLAILRAVERSKPADLMKLNGIVDDMRAAAQAGDLQKLGALDLAFHEHIVRMAQHDLLLKLWKLLEIGVQRCLHARYRRYASPELIIGSHPAIVDAIASRNKRTAATVLHEHIGEAAERVLEDFPISLPENGLLQSERAYP